jgi:hypothetical protein
MPSSPRYFTRSVECDILPSRSETHRIRRDIIEKAGDQVNYSDPEKTKSHWQREYETLYTLLDRLEKTKK